MIKTTSPRSRRHLHDQGDISSIGTGLAGAGADGESAGGALEGGDGGGGGVGGGGGGGGHPVKQELPVPPVLRLGPSHRVGDSLRVVR